MLDKISIGISFPKEIVSKIDTERGDISRSRYLLRIVEKKLERSETEEKKYSKSKNSPDPLESRFERLQSSESMSSIGE
jgi:metal-responsive CopG/Arc/MetJ family transcriptional regulator